MKKAWVIPPIDQARPETGWLSVGGFSRMDYHSM